VRFELEPYHRNTPDKDLIKDVIDVAKKTGRNTVTMAEYQQYGKYHPTTLTRRFRSWFNVLEKAGLQESRSKLNIPEEELFDNLKNVWITLARQPKYQEFKKPLSKYSVGTYENRFGLWRKALEAFIEYINLESDAENEAEEEKEETETETSPTKPKRRTRREISERQRFRILLRDGFRCQSCGRSPLKLPGVELHVDHVIPWSKGGETVDENLQVKCKRCNMGKGNAFDR
jgi:5-methylcytosine-specific restriction endonuclease McrA